MWADDGGDPGPDACPRCGRALLIRVAYVDMPPCERLDAEWPRARWRGGAGPAQ